MPGSWARLGNDRALTAIAYPIALRRPCPCDATKVNDTGELPRRLEKGANIGLRELDAELGSVTVILESGGAEGCTVAADVSVLLLSETGKVRTDDDLVFYNQQVALGGAVHLREKVRPETDGPSGAGSGVSADVVTLELDNVPDDIQRIVLAGSLDIHSGVTFGDAAVLSLRLQRTADARDLLSFPIEGASTETALLFGEFYRRNGDWRVRAVGQGYDGGLAALLGAHGIDVQDPSGSDSDVATRDPKDEIGDELSRGEDESAEAGSPSDEVPSAMKRISVRRPTRAPRMPSDWGATIPTDDATDWHPARLFPVAGIGSGEEQERRATSALLAVMTLVKEFGRVLTSRCSAPSGGLETFIEVPFGLDEEAYRPDGVLRVKRGQRTWQALVEVKTAAGKLKHDQVDSYVEIARDKGFDAVVTISNELSGTEESPVAIDRRKLRKVKLVHLSWDQIRTDALLLLGNKGVADPTQQRVLEEFVRYMKHPRSGLPGFNDMGPRWVGVREAVKSKTLRSGDKNTAEVSNRFDQLIQHVAFELSACFASKYKLFHPETRRTPQRDANNSPTQGCSSAPCECQARSTSSCSAPTCAPNGYLAPFRLTRLVKAGQRLA
jgi:stress response protein SCP2